MTESQTYDKCLERMAEIVENNKTVYGMLIATPGFSEEIIATARELVEQGEETMRRLVELRLTRI